VQQRQCLARIGCGDPLAGGEQHRVGIGGDPDLELDPPAQVSEVRAHRRLLRHLAGRLDDRHRAPSLSPEPGLVGRGGQSPGPGLLVGRQRGGAIQRVGGGAVAAAALRPIRGSLELVGDLGVGSKRRRGSVPGAAVTVLLAVERLDQRQMDCLALGEAGALVHRGTDQRVTEVDRLRELQKPLVLGFLERPHLDAERLRPAHQDRGIAGLVGGGEEQQLLTLLGEPAGALEELGLQPGAQRQRLGRICAVERLVQLQQREGIAAGRGHQPVANVGRHFSARELRQQPARGIGVDPLELELRDPGGVERARLAGASAEDQGDRLGLEPAGDEGERVGGGLVQPMGVVDHAEQRLLLRGGGEQAEQCRGDQEAVVGGRRRLAQRAAQGGGLRLRDLIEVIEQRARQLVHRGERELELRLHPRGPDDSEVGRLVGGVRQQRRFADPRLATDHQHAAARLASSVEQIE
jgi:hypothetical protein